MIASGLITATGSPWRYVRVIFVIEVCSMSNLNHCVESLLQVCKVSAVIKVHFWKGYVADKVLKHWLFFIYRFYFSSVVVLVFLVTLWLFNRNGSSGCCWWHGSVPEPLGMLYQSICVDWWRWCCSLGGPWCDRWWCRSWRWYWWLTSSRSVFMNSVLSHNWGPSSGCSRSDWWTSCSASGYV